MKCDNLMLDQVKDQVFSKKAFTVWRVPFQFGLLIEYKSLPEEGLVEKLSELKTDGRISYFETELNDAGFRVCFAFDSALTSGMSIPTLGDPKCFSLEKEIVDIIDMYFPDKNNKIPSAARN
jgi:hypothetical protein